MACSHTLIGSTIKMTILNHANRLSLNLQMRNLLLGTTRCNNWDYLHLEKTMNFKQRIHKHKSDVKYPQNSTCRELSEHLRDCAKIEPFFPIYPFYHEKDYYSRGYKEKRFIIKWKPPLNINKT